MDWQPIATAPDNQCVDTKLDDAKGVRYEQRLKRSSNGLWWFPDGSMYVYYTPTHWKPFAEAPKRGMVMTREAGFYWVQIDDGRPGVRLWEPARWHIHTGDGLWLTLDGPFTTSSRVVRVGARIPDPPADMPFEEVNER